MGCAEASVTMLPDKHHQGARNALADPSVTSCGPHRSLPVAPLIAYQRCYGEAPGRLRRDCRPVSGNGPVGWRWVGGERLASLGSQPGSEVSTEPLQDLICARHLSCRILGLDFEGACSGLYACFQCCELMLCRAGSRGGAFGQCDLSTGDREGLIYTRRAAQHGPMQSGPFVYRGGCRGIASRVKGRSSSE